MTSEVIQQPETANRQDLLSTATEALRREKAGSCPNRGNPVFSCFTNVDSIKDDMYRNAFCIPHHPLYQTSSSVYGELSATSETAPSTFHGKSQTFSQHLGVCGMYRNHSLNTAMDKSNVYDQPKM